MADFETTTDPDDCRVWSWGLGPITRYCSPEDVQMGTDIDSFIKRCAQGLNIVYFHNLAFDGSFIMDWLMNNGYVWVEEIKKKTRTFTTLISGMGKFYSITVNWASGYTTEFRDSLKKLTMSVANVATAFELPFSKLEIDYGAYRPVGWELTEQEKEYLAADIIIMARALSLQFEQGMVKLTVGSDALAEYVKLLGGKRMFEKMFPVLPASMDDDVRAAYRGGWTYADERWSGKVHYKMGRSYDVNSLYSSVMYSELLPYGEPMFQEGEPVTTAERPLFITCITMTAKLKRNHLPCIQIKKNMMFAATEYQKEISEPVTISCTNIDLDLWNEHYDLNIISYNGSWLFKASRGMFAEYIDKWSEIKRNSKGGMRQLAKLQLNSLYGKFATNPVVTGKFPVLDEDGIVRLKLGAEVTRDPIYTPVGVFVTAYARRVTISAAQLNYDTFAYADTDSLHLWVDSDPETLDIDPQRLGAWKHEDTYDAAIYARAKAYAERNAETGEVSTHIAGVPLDIAREIGLDRFRDGEVFHGKLVPKRVKGGIVLQDTHFTLKL